MYLEPSSPVPESVYFAAIVCEVIEAGGLGGVVDVVPVVAVAVAFVEGAEDDAVGDVGDADAALDALAADRVTGPGTRSLLWGPFRTKLGRGAGGGTSPAMACGGAAPATPRKTGETTTAANTNPQARELFMIVPE